MHDFHIKEHNLAELLRIDPGGFIIVWPPEDKPKARECVVTFCSKSK